MTTLELYNADCLIAMKKIKDKSVDLILCDLPYGILKAAAHATHEEGCGWDVPIHLEIFWREVKRIRKNEHTPCIHFCSTKFGVDLINSNPTEFRYDLVWVKPSATGFLSVNKKPMTCHEMIYVFSKAGANYTRIDILGDFKCGGGGRSPSRYIPAINAIENPHTDNTGRRAVKSCIEFNNKKVKGEHPTAKPIDLYKWLIERYSKAGDTVLDPTFGSCNSGIAARELGRHYIGIEKDEVFYKKAKKKLNLPMIIEEKINEDEVELELIDGELVEVGF
jgi:site-specific DNA-methyltransferase (adenine-specific)